MLRYARGLVIASEIAGGGGARTRKAAAAVLGASEAVSDVLVRRTGSFFWSADGDITTIERVCDVLDTAHAYTPAQRHQQQTDYMRWIQRNRGIRTES